MSSSVQLLTFEYTSVHGALAAAYTSGALASEFGPELVRVALCTRSGAQPQRYTEPLLAELPLIMAEERRNETRLLGIVHDGDGPAWALLTAHVNLELHAALLVRALGAVLQARPHRKPVLDSTIQARYTTWLADFPLRAANILVIEDFVATLPMAA